MKLLLTSSGISNSTIQSALVGLLGKPISEANALCIPTGVQPFPGGPAHVYRFITGQTASPMCGLGWKSLGVLELTALPSIKEEYWVSAVQEADALLVWGGDPLYLSDWMRRSGLAALFPSLHPELVYVGVSAGAMAASAVFGETYLEPPGGSGSALTSERIVFSTPEGDVERIFVTAQGVGLVDFALIPHLENENHPDASLENAEKWAARLDGQTYAIDDQTGIQVVNGNVEVVSEGHWRLFSL